MLREDRGAWGGRMSWGTIGTIYAKEVRDLLRDRRTVLSTIVIPTVVMPLIIFGFISIASKIVSKARAEVPRVMLIGGADSPGIRSRLEKSGKFKVESASADWKALISDKRVRAAVEVPEGFERALDAGSAPAITLYDYQGEMKSGLAVDQLERFFTELRDGATARLLADRGPRA